MCGVRWLNTGRSSVSDAWFAVVFALSSRSVSVVLLLHSSFDVVVLSRAWNHYGQLVFDQEASDLAATVARVYGLDPATAWDSDFVITSCADCARRADGSG
jgi:hypothetical protein